MSHIIVVGGGLSGMSAAVRIAKNRHHRVTLIEKSPTLGGRLLPENHSSGPWHLDSPLATMPAVFSDLFKKSGRRLERTVEFSPAPPLEVRLDDDSLLLGHGSRGEQLDSLTHLPWASVWNEWLDQFTPAWNDIRRSVLESSLIDTRRSHRPQWFNHHIAAVANELTHPSARDLAVALATTDSTALTGNSALWLARAFLIRTVGLWQFPDGWSALSDSMVERVAQRGVEVVTASASGVTKQRSRITGVRLANGPSLAADQVIWTAPVWPEGIPQPRVRTRQLSTMRSLVQIGEETSHPGVAMSPAGIVRWWPCGAQRIVVAHHREFDPTLLYGGTVLTQRSPADLAEHGYVGWDLRGWRDLGRVVKRSHAEGFTLIGGLGPLGAEPELALMASAVATDPWAERPIGH